MSDIHTSTDHQLGKVTTEVDFDWRALGHHFLQASSEDQAAFLLGWSDEGRSMGWLHEDMQYRYISEAFRDEQPWVMADRLYRLAEQIDPTMEERNQP